MPTVNPAPVATVTEVLQRLNDPALVANDKNLVSAYVKKTLFERVTFVWDQKSLNTGEKLHADYLENCKALVADGQLQSLSNEESTMYMDLLWSMMTKEQCYRKWIASKRSNAHQAMQDGFRSKSRSLDAS